MQKFKVGDKVKVTSGKDKGREGSIERLYAGEGNVLIPGINMVKKHVKAALTADKKGGIFDIPKPISVAKIAIVCPKCKKLTRVGFKTEKGKKIRICRKCGKGF